MKNLFIVYLIMFSNLIYADCFDSSSGIRKLENLDKVLKCFANEVRRLKDANLKLNNKMNSLTKKINTTNALKEFPSSVSNLSKTNNGSIGTSLKGGEKTKVQALVITKGDYSSEFKKCSKMNHSTVECVFLIKNSTKEHLVGLDTERFRLFSNDGSVYIAKEAFLGSSGGRKNNYTPDYSFSIPSNIAIKGRALFEGVNDEVPSRFQFKIHPKNNRKDIKIFNFNIP